MTELVLVMVGASSIGWLAGGHRRDLSDWVALSAAAACLALLWKA